MVLIISTSALYRRSMKLTFPSPCGDYGSYLHTPAVTRQFFPADVSVPLRGLWFLSPTRQNGAPSLIISGFRPLAGIMVLICNDRYNDGLLGCHGFRPLAGIMVLIDNDKEIGLHLFISFPSPCGDYGSYQGEHYGIQNFSKTVSVPLRGLWFLSQLAGRSRNIFPVSVSVPLRGLWFLSWQTTRLNANSAMQVSVPLRGLWFLSGRPHIFAPAHEQVSVPLRGLWFLSTPGGIPVEVNKWQGFRPLAGIMVLIPSDTGLLSV